MPKHILVAIDGSDGSRRAAEYARDLARSTGARLTLMIAIQPPTTVAIPPFDAFSITSAHPDPEHISAARALIDEVERDLGAQAGSHVGIGPAAEAICEDARKLGADLIVVGARGLSGPERLLLGSVSERVVREADRPVLVVR